jgi:hypothetical protein
MPAGEQTFVNLHTDNAAGLEGLEILGPMPAAWKADILSCILKDPFHIFNMFYISTSHGLCINFAQALHDTMFIPDPVDVEWINIWGCSQNPPTTFDKLQKYKAQWLWVRCK